MTLLEYLKNHGHSLAASIGTSKAYLSQLAHGHRKASPKMVIAIEIATEGAVSREDLRPDIYCVPKISNTPPGAR